MKRRRFIPPPAGGRGLGGGWDELVEGHLDHSLDVLDSCHWIPLVDLVNIRFFPAALVPNLVALFQDGVDSSRYLGEVD
jgi:hypothetical protein